MFIDRGVTPETASVFQPSPVATTAACPVNPSSSFLPSNTSLELLELRLCFAFNS